MLYHLHEWQHSSLLPMRLWAKANMALYSRPFGPFSYSPMSRMIVAGSDLLLRTTRRYAKPRFGLTETVVDGNVVGLSEETILNKTFCALNHFKRDTDVRQPTVLVVAPLSGHYATLLRDTIRTLVRDHEVYITDWQDARMVLHSKGPFH